SNRGINEIRELREKVKYLPNNLRKKIYIIDEVHMLTTEAFNALLKILEEPPEHVIFIMATTEPDKVIPTIMSRCQRFDFFPVTLDLIRKRLKEIAKAEKISITDSALGLIAKYADGSLRDADGILEQLAAYSEGKIGPKEVVALLGVVDLEVLFEFIDILAGRDVKKGLGMINRITKGNQNLKNFVSELMDHLYNLYVVKNYEKPSEAIDLSKDYLDKYKKQAGKLQNEEIEYYLEHFTELLKQVKWGESAKTFFKSSAIQAINYIVLDDRQLEKKTRAWDARLNAIERQLKNSLKGIDSKEKTDDKLDIINEEPAEKLEGDSLKNIVTEEEVIREIEETSTVEAREENIKKEEPVQGSGSGGTGPITDNIDSILEVLKKKRISVYAMFVEAEPGRIEDGTAYFYLDEDKKWHKDHLNKSVNLDIISEVIKKVTGKKYKVKFETGETGKKNMLKNHIGATDPSEETEHVQTGGPDVYENPDRGQKDGTIERNDSSKEKGAGDIKKNDSSSGNKLDGSQNEKPEDDPSGKGSGKDGEEDIIKYFEAKFKIKE
ncbi:MAG: DNA polymerase III subunit gamma/tau, partial [Actinomycetia bacterium]|nr:DNA polymerase III subunit gamma/tau [Actinomycetes bacterium]